MPDSGLYLTEFPGEGTDTGRCLLSSGMTPVNAFPGYFRRNLLRGATGRPGLLS